MDRDPRIYLQIEVNYHALEFQIRVETNRTKQGPLTELLEVESVLPGLGYQGTPLWR
jgi:hypothetical protein